MTRRSGAASLAVKSGIAYSALGRSWSRKSSRSRYKAMASFVFLVLAGCMTILFPLSLQCQTVTLSPTNLVFNAQVVSTTSTAKAFTLKNGQTVVLNISSISTSGDYAETDNCGSALSVGASCTISVTFTPMTTGSRPGTLAVMDDATYSPQTASLSGAGILPVVLYPANLSFGNQVINNTSPAKLVTLKNNQPVALNISSIAASGDFAETNNCGASLAANGSTCTVNVTFMPTAIGSRAGTLTVTDDASNNPQTVSLNGIGVPPAGLTPINLTFKTQTVNTTSPAKVVTLKNNQSVALNISSIRNSGDFAQSNNCGSTLPAGASCTVSATFTPTATGPQTGTLTVSDDASNSPQTASLSGTGANPPVISSLFPASGTIGTPVTITGSRFGNPQGSGTVTFNGILSAPTSWSGTSITAPVPSGAASGRVVVTANGGASNGVNFTIVPIIASLSSTSGPIGTPVTITGSGFGNIQANSIVTFNGTTALPTSWSDSSIVVPVPNGATSGKVVVAVDGQASNGIDFSVPIVARTLQSISLTPANASVTAGTAQAYTAIGTYSDGSTQDVTSTTMWATSDPTVAVIDATGLASAIDTGQAVIQANMANVSGSATLTVTPGLLDAIITPAYTPANRSAASPIQKAIAIGADGFTRFVTADSSCGYGCSDQIVYVRCLDADCASSHRAVFTPGNWTTSYSMALGPDGLARIAYSTFSNVPAQHDSLLGFISCLDDDCVTYTNSVVDGASDNGVASIAVASDGTSYIVYDYGYAQYDNVSEYDEQGVGLATCNGTSCSIAHIAPVDVFDAIGAAITIGGDGSPVVVYEDSGNSGHGIPDSVHYYTHDSDTVVSSHGGGGTNTQDLAIGPDGFARIVFVNAENTADFVLCTNISCSANISSSSTITFSGTSIGNLSVGVIADGTAIIAGTSAGSAGSYIDYVSCTVADCSSYNDQQLPGSWNDISLAIDLDGLPRTIAQEFPPDASQRTDHIRKPPPDHLLVVNDETNVDCTNCTTVRRTITYSEVDVNEKNVGTISTKEQFGSIEPNTCNSGDISSQVCAPDKGGILKDLLWVGFNTVGDPCGFTATNQQWLWCPRSDAAPVVLATTGDLVVHNDSVTVHGCAKFPKGTKIYASGDIVYPPGKSCGSN